MKCVECSKNFEGYQTARFCTNECRHKFVKRRDIEKMVAKSRLKFPDGTDPSEYVECGICGYRTSDLVTHPRLHGLTNLLH